MATAVARQGFKRSHDEMTRGANQPEHPKSTQASRIQSPSATASRASSQAPDAATIDNAILSNIQSRKVSFEPNASLVLVGVRGVGKSTLGVLAAAAYSRRLVETDRAFFDATGSTATAYRKAQGTAEYQRRHNQVLETLLEKHSSGAVFVCSFSDLEGNGANILHEYAQAHPVIHVTRDVEGLQSYLRIWTPERVKEVLSASSPLLRSCSNYEFYNLTDTVHGNNTVGHDAKPNGNGVTLTLKRVERDFLRLLRNVIGDHERGQSHHSAYPFSQVELERRPRTFAVAVKACDVLKGGIDFDDAQTGADCFELSIEVDGSFKRQHFIDISKAFAIVRRATILPILLSAGKNSSAYPAQQNEERLAGAVDHCLRLGAEFCTADLIMTDSQLKNIIQSKGHSRIIGRLELCTHLKEGWNDPSVAETYIRAVQLGCDLVKLTMPASAIDDAFELQALQTKVKALKMSPGLIAYNTGPKGRTSKCFNKIFTSVEHHPLALREVRDDTVEDVSAQDVTRALFASFILEPMRFYIYGSDVSYSLSPVMHNAAYTACGMRYNYQATSSDSMDTLKEMMEAHDFGGSAITQPYKTLALGIMDALSPHAKAIGAVNTIIPVRQMSQDGTMPSELDVISQRGQRGPVKALYGFNTDWIGIRACIRRGLSPANTVRSNTSAVVCGAGGMARSAIYSLISLGVRNIFICNRTLVRAKDLADHYNDLIANGDISELRPENASQTHVKVLETFADVWPNDARAPTIIVCCIPRRTRSAEATNFALPENWLKSPTGGVVLEVAYRQPTSPIEHQIRSRAQEGWIFMDGYDVLPEQAFSQFELFTGRRAPRKLMRDEIQKHINQ